MSRLPVVGQDDDIWGEILNDFLSVAHNTDGTLKKADLIDSAVQSINGQTGSSITLSAADIGAVSDSAAVHKAGAETVSGVKTFSTSPIVPTPTSGNQAVNKTYVDSVGGGGDPAMGGDLSGTASNAQIVAGTITDTEISATANISQAKIANLASDIASKEAVISAGTTSQYWRGDKSWQSLDKSAVGLSNVDNTSDTNKPVSTATQTALNAKTDKSTLTAKGDIYAATAASTPTRLGVGSDGQVLTADSSQPTGLKWASTSGGFVQGDGIAKMTVGSTQPASPSVGDVWIQTP